jgi:uracil-DNA glycosylase family 4
MDKREAMLRELNLYPLWVRREPAVQRTVASERQTSEGEAGIAAVSADRATVADRVVHCDEPVAVSVMPEQISDAAPVASMPVESLFEANPDDKDQVLKVAGEDSLREFQLQNQGGALGRVDWPELMRLVQGCELCALRAGCTQTVAGCGREQADWMFIGEAPGFDEDATGVPFTGHAGRLLDNMLLAISLKRSEVYIANVIKCRPPDDRHPHVGEIASCLPYLKRQIDLVQPKVIVALGKTAASALLDTDATIASLRGKLHEYKGIPLIVTFHPAYLLRSPPEKAKAWQDLRLAVATMQAINKLKV